MRVGDGIDGDGVASYPRSLSLLLLLAAKFVLAQSILLYELRKFGILVLLLLRQHHLELLLLLRLCLMWLKSVVQRKNETYTPFLPQ